MANNLITNKMETEKFLEKWGQSHEELCSNLDYDINDSDDLIMIDYFMYNDVWIPINSSYYTNSEQKFANKLRLS